MQYRRKTMSILVAAALSCGMLAACGETDDPSGNHTQENQNNDTQNNQNNDTQNNQNNDTLNNQNNDTLNNQNQEDPEPRPAAAGDVLLSEFMKSPRSVAVGDGQWVEFYNPVNGQAYDLQGCEIWTSEIDGPGEITESLEVAPGEFVTVANGDAPGFEPDYVMGGLLFSEGAGYIRLECDGTEITSVVYDGGTYYPGEDGASLVRDPDFYELGDEDQPWLWCAGSEPYNGDDLGSPGAMAEPCPWFNEDSASDILSLRMDGEEADPMTLEGVLVTYVRPRIGSDSAGFFIQASQNGPALFVPTEEAETVAEVPVRTGQVIDLEVQEMGFNGGVSTVAEFGDIDVVRLYVPPSLLTTDITDFDDILDDIYKYDSRLISAEFMVLGEYDYAGAGFRAFPIFTEGMEEALADLGDEDGELLFRVPVSIIDDLGLDIGCIVTISDVPMWRFWDDAQLSIWQHSELGFEDCPLTQATSAISTGPATVEVRFSRPLVGVSADDFTIDGLDVNGASADGRVVTLETSDQVQATTYTVEVSSDLNDLWGRPALEGQVDFYGHTARPQQAMDVVISEFMAQFQSGTGTDPGEYIEIHNTSSEPFNLNGCVLGKTDTQNYTIDADILLEPGDDALFTRTAGGAADLDEDDVFQFTNLVNAGGTLFLECDGTTIDELTYEGSAVELGVSYQKDVDSLDEPNTGDLSEHWCLTPQTPETLYWTGDANDPNNEKYGTPGEGNVSCQ